MYDQVASGHAWSERILIGNLVLTFSTTASLILRICARLITKTKFGWDDYVLFLGQAFWYGQITIQIFAALAAKKMITFADSKFLDFLYWVFIAKIFYYPIALCAAVSILLFYRRIFPVPQTKRLVSIFIILHVLWGISSTLVQIFMCRPLNTWWTNPLEAPNKCINYPLFFLISTSLEIGLDTLILVLPIKQIMRLNLPMGTKLPLATVFLIGGLSILSNVARAVHTYLPGELFINLAADMFWIDLHQAAALICANLPVCKPLIRRIVAFVSTNASSMFVSSSPHGSHGAGYSSKKSTRSKSYPDATSRRNLVVEGGLRDHEEIRMEDYNRSEDQENDIYPEKTINIV